MIAQRKPKPSPQEAPRKLTARSARAALRREQLLSVAQALFCAHGYAATSTQRIAEAAGVTEGLIFHYFTDKNALLLELLSKRSTFAGRMVTLLFNEQHATARGLLAAIAAGYAEVGPEEAALVAFANAEAQVNAGLRGYIMAGTAVMLDALVDRLSRRVAAGELREDAPLRATALGFFGGFAFFFAQHRELSGAAWRREAASFAEAWSEQCWRGLASLHSLTEHSTKPKKRAER